MGDGNDVENDDLLALETEAGDATVEKSTTSLNSNTGDGFGADSGPVEDSILGEEEEENGDNGEFDDTTGTIDDPELEQIRAKVREMEEEAEKLKKMQAEAEEEMNLSAGSLPGASPAMLSVEEKKEIDGRSIYVGNVDYGATAEELEQHFHGCGSIVRVTINCDKFTGHPKGFAYIEFADADSTDAATALDESLFRGRQIKVVKKRTNIPGHSTTNRPPRGRFRPRGRGFRGSGGGAFRPRAGYRGGYRPRRPAYYSPY